MLRTVSYHQYYLQVNPLSHLNQLMLEAATQISVESPLGIGRKLSQNPSLAGLIVAENIMAVGATTMM